jgi:hypothetical protein
MLERQKETVTDEQESELAYSTVPPVASKLGVDPKGLAGLTKPPMWLCSPAGMEAEAWAMGLGAKKYGPFNFRQNKVCMSTYLAAILRHVYRIIDGEFIDPESGQPHLGHIKAGCGIVLDAQRHGTLVDDRVMGGK